MKKKLWSWGFSASMTMAELFLRLARYFLGQRKAVLAMRLAEMEEETKRWAR